MAPTASTGGGFLPVLRLAMLSRLLLLALITLWRLLFHPYDTSASLNPPCLSGTPSPLPTGAPLLPRVGSSIERSIVWDSVYFVRIAECGYEYEQTYAFFPLLPALISALSRSLFAPLIPVIGYRAVLGLSGYVLNNVTFLFAALYLYRLSVFILKDHAAALQASALFCFNPASIFYSSIYSESLYAFFSFGGMYNLIAGYNIRAVFLFALSGSARSNGMLNAGYFCFQAMHQAYKAAYQKKEFTVAIRAIFTGAVQSLFIFAPFVVFQAYGYFNMCAKPGVDAKQLRPWCTARIPILYNYLQSHYWGVGFLRYFQVKQLPNFLLASPILSLAICSIIQFAKLRSNIMFSLGIRALHDEKGCFSKAEDSSDATHAAKIRTLSKVVAKAGKLIQRMNKKESKETTFEAALASRSKDQDSPSQVTERYFSILMLPFIYHLTFLTLTAFFVMHVQVASRFLSACPPIYWFASYVMRCSDRRFGYLIWAYFLSYILLGSLLFSNFYPFT